MFLYNNISLVCYVQKTIQGRTFHLKGMPVNDIILLCYMQKAKQGCTLRCIGMPMGMITLFWYTICSMQTRGTPLILEACLLLKPLYRQAMCTSQEHKLHGRCMNVGEKLIFVKLCAVGKNIGMTLCQRHAFRMTRFEVWVGQ